jgi:drug/metabolite transporter (DMT)-like permease
VGFTAYVWLLRATTPARVATYAYVNPVVAVLLGWAFANEPLTGRTALAAGVVLAAVALITARKQRSTPPDVSKPAQNRPLGGRSRLAVAHGERG